MGKILNFCNEPICLFCGKKIKQKWEDGECYYECDCKDAKLNREIDEKIRILNNQRPIEKFIIDEVRYLRKLK